MDFTKIKPVEYNGQRVAPTRYLIDCLMETCDLVYKSAESRIFRAKKVINLIKFFDYFRCAEPGFGRGGQCFYTKSGVLKLSEHFGLEDLKDFAAEYFDTTDDLPAPLAEPAVEPAAITEVAQAETPDVTDLIPVEWSAQRVLTTEQLAQFYQCGKIQIIKNFNNNKDKFVESKHYFKVEGEELNNLRIHNLDMQISPMARRLYLWTERGAARHAKLLTTEKAWGVFELLEDNYFNAAKPAEPAETPFDCEEAIDKATRIKDKIKRFIGIGVKEEMLLAQSIYAAEKFFNQDLSFIRNCIPAATHKIGYMNATELGKKVDKSSHQIGKEAVEKGVAFRDDKGNLRLTELGKKYAESVAFEKNGHSDYQIKWNDDAVAFFSDSASLFN